MRGSQSGCLLVRKLNLQHHANLYPPDYARGSAYGRRFGKLFAHATSDNEVFMTALAEFFEGRFDNLTLERLGLPRE